MKYCIEGKQNQSSQKKVYTEFVKWLFNAYCEIRVRYKFFKFIIINGTITNA